MNSPTQQIFIPAYRRTSYNAIAAASEMNPSRTSHPKLSSLPHVPTAGDAPQILLGAPTPPIDDDSARGNQLLRESASCNTIRPEVQQESALQGSTATPGAWMDSNAAEATYGHVLTSCSPDGRAREDTQYSHRPKLSSLSIPVQASAHLDICSISSISSMTSSITTASPLPIDTWLEDQGRQIMKDNPLVGLQEILFAIVPSKEEIAKGVAVPREILLEARGLVAEALKEVQQPPRSALSDRGGHLSSQTEGCNVSGEEVCRRTEKLLGHQRAVTRVHELLFAITLPETETAKDVPVPSHTLIDAMTLVTEVLEEVRQLPHSAPTDLGGHLSRQTKGGRVSDVEIRGRKELSECSGNGAIEDAGPDPELLRRQRRRETLTMAKIITPFIV